MMLFRWAMFAFVCVILWVAPAAFAANPMPALATVLDEQGQLALPEGYRGSLDPTGFRIVSRAGEPLRFAKAGQVDDRWSGTGTVGNGCNDSPNAIAVDGAGRVYVGGRFTQCGNVTANFVAVFDPATQTWASLGSGTTNGVSSVVNAIAIVGTDVYVGGFFDQAGGVAANNVARFSTATQSWSVLGSGVANGVDGRVTVLTGAGNDLYVGGAFSQAGGVAATNLARFTTTTQTWSSLGSGTSNGVGGSIFSLAVAGDDVYVGGFFLQAGGVAANSIARFNTLTQSWSSLGSGISNGVSNSVFTIAIAGADLYVGGSFTEAGGFAANRVARFNISTQTWFPLGSGVANGVNGLVNTLAVTGNNIYVGGQFAQAGGLMVNRIARFDAATQTWLAFDGVALRGAVSAVNSIAFIGSDLYVGGRFTQAGGAPASHLARFMTTTQTWSPLGSGASGLNQFVRTLAIAGDDVYVGGGFSQAGEISANHVARINIATQTWASLGSAAANGVNNTVLALDINGTDVYVGGPSFTQAGTIGANRVARFNTLTQTWSPLGSAAVNGVDGIISALAISGGVVHVGGFFTRAGDAAAQLVARFDTTTQVWSSLGSGVNLQVFALAVNGNDVYVGGAFTQAGGMGANRVARFNTATAIWSPLGIGPANGVNGEVNALVISGSDVVVGGSFTQAGGVAADRVARFNTVTQTWSPLVGGTVNGVNATVRALAATDSDIYVGGDFSQAGGAPANRLARFSIPAQRWFPVGSGVSMGSVLALKVSSGTLMVGGQFGAAGRTITSNLARYRIGAPTTVTLAVTSAGTSAPSVRTESPGFRTPSGLIRVLASTGETCSITAPLGNCSITFASAGARTVAAVYDGDGDYEANASENVSIMATSGSTLDFAVTLSVTDRVFASGFDQL